MKLSGEALAGPKKTGFDEETVRKVAVQVKELADQGTQVGIVIGGGNFWRGRTSENIDRTKADQIGMLATVMNCIYVSEMFRGAGDGHGDPDSICLRNHDKVIFQGSGQRVF